jgi:5'-nucleotidase
VKKTKRITAILRCKADVTTTTGKFAAITIALLLLSSCGSLQDARIQTGATVTISVIGTNDVHGRMIERNGAGGLALFGGYLSVLRDVRARDGGAVLLIDAGDMWQGTLESNLPEGAPVVAAYNALGYNAAAIGNHEFDFGPVGPAVTTQSDLDDRHGALKARAREAEFPLLAANLIDGETGSPVDWPNVRPSHLLDVAGVSTGIIGITSRNTLGTTLSANVADLRVANLAETIEAQARTLRDEGARLVIVAAHAGGECSAFGDPGDTSSCDPDSEIFALARALPAGLVDLIVGGHVHQGMAHEVNGIAIISSWSGGRFFGRVDFRVVDGEIAGHLIFPPTRICRYVDTQSGHCLASGDAANAEIATYEGRSVNPDPVVAAVLAPAIAATAALKREKVGPFLETPFLRRDDPESPIGNLLTDIMLASAPNADAAIHNTVGGIRADLPAGQLTYGSVYEMFPFDNRIVHLILSGAELRAVLANQLLGPTRRSQVSGVRVVATCQRNTLQVVLLDRNQREINDDERLRIVTSDFLVSGGDGALLPAMPPGGFAAEYEGPLMRDLIVDWMRKERGRLNAAQFFDESKPRWVFPRPAPVRCTSPTS